MAKFDRLHFTASDHPDARAAHTRLEQRYGAKTPDNADALVALGGDGFMLQVLHEALDLGCPVFGMNFGSVGFLMNTYRSDALPERLRVAERTRLRPLRMRARTEVGDDREALAFNEVSLYRQTRQSAKLRIFADGRERLAELVCDGVIVSTPAGSTAYNFSAHGPILPIDAKLIALSPISAFRPRRWRGAILPEETEVRVEVRESRKRPVSAVADFAEIRDVVRVEVGVDAEARVDLLFDPGHNLEERVVQEQFAL